MTFRRDLIFRKSLLGLIKFWALFLNMEKEAFSTYIMLFYLLMFLLLFLFFKLFYWFVQRLFLYGNKIT